MKIVAIFTHKIEMVSKSIFERYSKELTDLTGNKHGVYALYDENELYYVGKAVDLKRRVGQHLKDKHLARWTHFSLFLTSQSKYIDEIESILVRIANPKGNLVKPKGKMDSKLKKQVISLVKAKQKEELNELFGIGRKPLKTEKRQKGKKSNPNLKNYFNNDRSLSKNYKGVEYSATLLKNGKIKYKNKTYDTPTAAAEVITSKRNVNGWTFWYVKDHGGDWVKLKSL